MRRGSMIAGVLSLLGAAGAVAVAAAGRDFLSMYSAIAIVLTVNAVVRFLMVRGAPHDSPRQR